MEARDLQKLFTFFLNDKVSLTGGEKISVKRHIEERKQVYDLYRHKFSPTQIMNLTENDFDFKIWGHHTSFCLTSPIHNRRNLAGRISDEEYKILRKHERTGRPLGNTKFIARLEEKLGKALIPQKGWRPKKKN